MKKFRSLRGWMAGALVISSLTMCHKKEKETPSPQQNYSVEAVASCTYTIQASQTVVDGSTIPAGSTVCIQAGTRGPLSLKNFHGTPSSPIVFINKGGKVVFQVPQTNGYSIKTDNCSNFKLLGTGDPSIKYGIEVNGSNNGVSFDHLSTDFEVSNLEVHDTKFAGIMAKTDPACDPATWRGNFTMKNLSFHDNYVHNTGGEGFYIGNSFFANGHQTACGVILPHEVWGVKVFNNTTQSTGAEGIQVGSATKGCEIYSNQVLSPGQSPFAAAQNNGIQMGEGTGGKCYNNIVKSAPGAGIIVLGLGDNIVYNNIILNSGSHGIFADSRYTPGPNFKFINNTIIAPGGDGVRLYSETIPMNTVINNVIVKPGSGNGVYKRSNLVKVTESNNYINNDITACKFVNPGASDYKLSSGSPLIDKGMNTSSFGIITDYYNTGRPSGVAFDIGATEYKGVVTSTPGTSPSAPTDPVAGSSLAVTSFTLLNAVTKQEIGIIANGATINLAKLGTNRLVIRANTNPSTVGSVIFGYDLRASFHTENGTAPYTLLGDYPGIIYNAWIPSLGKHTITATPYSGSNRSGSKGNALSITVNVVNSPV